MNVPHQLKSFLDDVLLRAIGDIGEGVFVLEDPRVVYANEAICVLTGYTEKEIIALSSFHTLLPENQRKSFQENVQSHINGEKQSGRYEISVKHKKGGLISLELSMTTITGSGETQIMCLARDLTNQKTLLETEERLKTIIVNAPLVLFSVDPNGMFTLSEGNGLKALNLEPGQVVGQSALELYREYPSIVQDLRRALKGEKFSTLSKVNDRYFETHYSPANDMDGKLQSVIGIAIDITERKHAEKVLERRIEFEKLITSLSSHFINLPFDKIDSGIANALASIGQFIGVDRISIIPHKNGKMGKPIHQWAAEERSITPLPMGDLNLAEFTWFQEKIKSHEVLHISSIKDLPAEAVRERNFLQQRDVRSIVLVPMITADKFNGLISFSTVETPKVWTEGELALFKIIGEMLSSALERKRSEQALRGSEEKFRELFNNANDAIFLYGISDDGVPGKFLEVNDVACSKMDYSRDELLQMTPYDIASQEDLNEMPKIFKKLLQQERVTYEKTHLTKSGSKLPFEINAHLFLWNGQKVVQAIARDVSDRKRAEETIRRQSFYDILTNLPNRTLFKDRLDQAMKNARRNKQNLCVIILDLDRFKNINETLGHVVGDKLLVAVAERLLGVLNENETIARFGGDEFTLLLPQVTMVEEATQHAQKIIELLATPFKLNGHELHVTTSIGMAFYPEDGENPEILLKNAETAMYRAKEQGRNNFQLYASVMNVSAFKQLLMENSLRRALEKEEFVVYYQPQIDLKTRQIVGAEALVRWQHPDLGLVFPTEFIGLAEETGLIVPIGEWVMRKVCTQSKKWQEAGQDKVCIAVNLSARQFQQRNLVNTISQILQETGLDAQYLGLEITESIAMKNADFTIAALNEFKKMGIHLSLDDFGTGYSSLSYLKRFPLETLKIDRSFVRDITTDPNDAAIVTAVIALAHSLKLSVVAEGVETEGQLTFLKTHDCDQVQGYYFSHPLSEENFLKILKDYPRR